MGSILEVDNLTLGYGKILAVRNVSLAVEDGQIVALLGPNGAGKSTIVRGIAGLLKARTGAVRLRGERISGSAPHRMVGMGLALVPQGRELFPDLSVIDNLRLGGYAVSRGGGVSERIETLFNHFPRLRDRRAQRAGNLSGGEQQMLAIARALVSNPSVLVLDEPSAGLAPKIMRQVFDIVAGIAREDGASVLIAEQNAHQALRITDYAYVLEAGHVVARGTPEQLMSDDTMRAAYLGDAEPRVS